MTEQPASNEPEQEFDLSAFRNALGRFATGVTIVTTTDAEGRPLGMTMSSFNSVSLSPPLVLFSIDRRANSLPEYELAKGFAINVLDQQDEELCMRFARALTDKWDQVPYQPGFERAPLLNGTIAQFECKPYARYDGGDHVIFVVEVVDFHVQPGTPLVFYSGKFQQLSDGNKASDDVWPLAIHY